MGKACPTVTSIIAQNKIIIMLPHKNNLVKIAFKGSADTSSLPG